MFSLYDNSKIITAEETDFDEKFCDNCNTSLSDILCSGVVGCSCCYKTFQNEICNYLLRSQGSFLHVGKIALKRNSQKKINEEIRELESQKQKAVDDENFILAETLKNQIEKLKGSL